MRRLSLLVVALFVAVTLAACSMAPRLLVAPMDHSRANVGALYPAADRAVAVSVKDRRPPGQILGGGLLGPIYLGYVGAKDDEVVDLMRSSAGDAVAALGMKSGEGGSSLEIGIDEFRVTMYRFSGFSPMNCIGYGKLKAALKSADAPEPVTKSFNVTYYEATTPVGSMKEVAREAVTRIYRQAAWEASATTLSAAHAAAADPPQVKRLLSSLATTKDVMVRRSGIFWLGLVGKDDPAVKEKLLFLFRTNKDQTIREAAAEAIGMLVIQEAREEILAALDGAKKVGDWDVSDAEQAWYLLKAASRLGVTDLRSHIPKADMKMRKALTDLAQFLETGEIPRMSETEQQELEKAKTNIIR